MSLFLSDARCLNYQCCTDFESNPKKEKLFSNLGENLWEQSFLSNSPGYLINVCSINLGFFICRMYFFGTKFSKLGENFHLFSSWSKIKSSIIHNNGIFAVSFRHHDVVVKVSNEKSC